MQQTTFDENGYLVPYDVIEMNLADFETHFAITQQRKFLFERLQNFLIDLVKLLKSPQILIPVVILICFHLTVKV